MTKPSEKTWRPRVTEWEVEAFLTDDYPGMDLVPDWPPKRPRPRTRKPNLKALLKEAAKAGLTIKAVVVEGESTRLEFGQPEAIPATQDAPAADDDINPWNEAISRATQ
jgi:hypothetical protein